MRKRYPSDISREEYEKIWSVWYILWGTIYSKKGCTWRGLPHDYPKWQNAKYHKKDKYEISLLDKILDNLVEKERKANGRESHTTMVIVDSKSIKNTSTAKEKGYDVGKKLLG